MTNSKKVAVIIPTYKTKKQILKVIEHIGPEVSDIYVIDDCCPEQTGRYVLEHCNDSRVYIHYHKENQGVGGAMLTGYQLAIDNNIDIVVKIDSDGQMAPELIPNFIAPIIGERAEYTKGNRFHNLSDLTGMPKIRLLGNVGLSFLNKMSSGYWDIFDPTNGYTVISRSALCRLDFSKVSRDYFFESDMLFNLGLNCERVQDIQMKAFYEDEKSNLKISKVLFPFLKKHIKNTAKRYFYQYFLRNFNFASIELLLGNVLFWFGIFYGGYRWLISANYGDIATSGQVMIAALPIILGSQLILSFLNYDMQNYPKNSQRGV